MPPTFRFHQMPATLRLPPAPFVDQAVLWLRTEVLVSLNQAVPAANRPAHGFGGIRDSQANMGGSRVTTLPNAFVGGHGNLDIRTDSANTLPCICLDGGRSASETRVTFLTAAGVQSEIRWTHLGMLWVAQQAGNRPACEVVMAAMRPEVVCQACNGRRLDAHMITGSHLCGEAACAEPTHQVPLGERLGHTAWRIMLQMNQV
jgi:hypothetical protein